MKYLLIIAAFLFVSKITNAQIADKVFQNGKIYTSNDLQPFAEAIAIKDSVFIFVGSNIDVVNHIGTNTIVQDLNGLLILPGIHDIHQHPLEAGSPIGGNCILDNMETNPENLGIALQSCNLIPNSNGWIIAYGHSIYTLYNATRNPKEILNDYYPNSPMIVMEETSHSVWVNSTALQVLGINSASTDPIGGHIFKDQFGAIYSIDGKLRKNLTINNKKIEEVNISAFENGTYFIELQLKNGKNLTAKFVKK